MAEWPVRAAELEYENPWYAGGYDEVEQPDGSTKRYYWADLPPAVVVVPLLDGEVVFVEQYRPVVRERHLELPAGLVEDGESYEAAGARELAEETGYRAEETTLMQTFDVATGVLRHERGLV
ncbi:MAG: NUDIX domain-containing protein, partial [Actinobacteria bacterium]|nr:NUDIX hydrolase [Actinomycetota bacterium]NIW27211.1 NUDIX domain-containing protein [Actinomycetota bacterium]NIX19748.1 NUDIX domain-containing protein [Actinomycetota bacterium]